MNTSLSFLATSMIEILMNSPDIRELEVGLLRRVFASLLRTEDCVAARLLLLDLHHPPSRAASVRGKANNSSQADPAYVPGS